MSDITGGSAVPSRATRREWIGLGVLTLAALVYAMDLTVLNLAIPRISAELRPTSAQLLWIIDIYGFLVAGLLITMGTLGDRIGRRKLLLGGAAGFAVASIRSVFLLGVPVMGLLLLLGPRTLPEYRDPNARRLDLRSAAMSLLAILAVVYGLKEIAQDGLAPLPILAIVAGVLLGILFVRTQLRIASPIIDVRLFRIRAFTASLGTYLLGIFVVVGYFLFISQYLQLVLGLSPIEAAVWSLPSALGFIAGSMLAPKIIHRYRPSVIMGVGMAIAGVGSVLLLGLGLDPGSGILLIVLASLV